MYAKIFAQILDSSIAEDYQVRRMFMDLLVLADPEGVVDMTHESIARRLNVPLDLVVSTMSTLSTPDNTSRTPDDDGRRIVLLDGHRNWGWKVVNFKKYHAMRDENARREYHRVYQQKRRSANKDVNLNVNTMSTPVNTCKPLSAPSTHVDVDVDEDTHKEETPPKPPRVEPKISRPS